MKQQLPMCTVDDEPNQSVQPQSADQCSEQDDGLFSPDAAIAGQSTMGNAAVGDRCELGSAPSVPQDLQQSPDVAKMSKEELDARIARVTEVLGQLDPASTFDRTALELQLDDLKAERLAREAFDTASAAGMKKADAPDEIALPPELVAGMQTAWEGSLPGGTSKEQGGILVRNADGSYEWKAGTNSTGGTFTPNDQDKDADEEMVAYGHTHPYDATEGGHTDVAFSGGDLANLVEQDVRFKMVQSGDGVFVVTKTAEFDARVKDLDQAAKDQLETDMKALWNTTFAGAAGTMQQKVEAAVKAVCAAYDLTFYKGSGNHVSKVK